MLELLATDTEKGCMVRQNTVGTLKGSFGECEGHVFLNCCLAENLGHERIGIDK